ncbi:hypothetical protein SGRIM128S_07474 [Streptomyces griseomycini]
MLERGLSVWNIHLESVYNDRAALGYARWLARDGGRVGTVPTLPCGSSSTTAPPLWRP